MKVAILSGSNSRNSGGLYNSVRRLAQSLNFNSIDARIFAHHDKFSRDDLSAYSSIQPISYDLQGPTNFGYSPNLYKILKQQSPDIIHTQCIWMYLSKVSLHLYKKHNIPHMISPRGMLDPWAVQHSAWKKRLAAKWFEDQHLNTAACIHALCQSEADAIRHYGLNNPIAIIPNGIDLPSMDITKETLVPDWKDRIAEGKKILLFLGRIHPKKGLLHLLEAWAMKQKEMNNWCLVVAGWDQGGYQKQLENKVKQWGLENNVFFVGTQLGDTKAASYLHADAFILPSLSEGLPMAVLEAWAYKLPVLITPFCNLPEGFHNNAAIQFDPNPESIKNVLLKLISLSENQLNEIGSNGYQLVKEKFTWERVAGQMVSVYQWVLSDHQKPVCITLN